VRPWGWIGIVIFFAVFTLFFAGVGLFGSQNPALGWVLAAFGCVCTYAAFRRGLAIEHSGVRIIRPWRIHDLSVRWDDIASFEMQTGQGQSPLSLVRASDQRRIPIPVFPKPRNAINPEVNPRYLKYHAKIKALVDELNATADAQRHSPELASRQTPLG
jgi:hypothetical protein